MQELHVHAHQIHFQDAHKFGHKCFQMKDDLGASLYSVLVKGRPLDDLSFQPIVNETQQFERESLENGRGRDAVRE